MRRPSTDTQRQVPIMSALLDAGGLAHADNARANTSERRMGKVVMVGFIVVWIGRDALSRLTRTRSATGSGWRDGCAAGLRGAASVTAGACSLQRIDGMEESG